jgi:hypothetical protein
MERGGASWNTKLSPVPNVIATTAQHREAIAMR